MELMPLIYADAGAQSIIARISGNDEVKQHLESLGFTVGATVSVVNSLAGNLIVQVKESRVALSKNLATKIYVK